MITCGVDIGSRSIEVVIFADGRVIETATMNSGSSPADNARAIFHAALDRASVNREDVAAVAATGYGRNYFGEADMVSSEILCHALGVSYLFPTAATVIDIGGQDSKMMRLDRNGRVTDFVMNDRCAAGTGKFIEMVSLMLNVPLEEMGDASAGEFKACEISSMCAVFAESEIIGLVQSGTTVGSVLRGVFRAIAKRTLSMTGRIGLEPSVVFTGGVALNTGVIRAFEEETGVDILVPPDPRITGALGAALMAAAKKRQEQHA